MVRIFVVCIIKIIIIVIITRSTQQTARGPRRPPDLSMLSHCCEKFTALRAQLMSNRRRRRHQCLGLLAVAFRSLQFQYALRTCERVRAYEHVCVVHCGFSQNICANANQPLSATRRCPNEQCACMAHICFMRVCALCIITQSCDRPCHRFECFFRRRGGRIDPVDRMFAGSHVCTRVERPIARHIRASSSRASDNVTDACWVIEIEMGLWLLARLCTSIIVHQCQWQHKNIICIPRVVAVVYIAEK